MDIYEITGYQSGTDREGVNYLQPSDSFAEIIDGFIHRQVLQSRKGISLFAARLGGDDGFRRVTGIFEHILPDSTRELLVTDQNYMYKYNTGTGVFDQLSFGGSMAAYGGFGLADNEYYISGTSYPDGSNSPRFVFTSTGMTANAAGSAVFFYDGTNGDIRDYTAVADNADYSPPVGLTLVRAKHVVWFGERLNFFVPSYTALTQQQGILFSGIRNSAGNGDKYDAVGAGEILLDTFEVIQGASILGDMMALNLSNSNWILEKTTDPFNPYRPRKIPSVIGTDAPFSFQQWDGRVSTIGRSGILEMTSQQSLRIDNKIPYFTADDIEQKYLDITYGGFDRANGQFLWSYVSSETEDDTQNRVLAYNYEEKSWSVFDLRLTVFGQTEIGREIVWNQIDENIKASWVRWDTTEELWNKIGLTALVQKTLAGDDEGFVYQLNQDYDDYVTAISAITQATSAVLTVDASAFKVGDRVVVSNVEGMTQINNFDPEQENNGFIPYEVTAATNTSVTLNVDSQNFDAYTTGGTLSKIISFSAKSNPFNPYRDNGRRIYVSMVEILLNTDVGKVYMDVYQDDEETPFKANVLMAPRDTRKGRNWIEMTVDNEADFFTFVFRMESPASHLEITSVRIHAMPGGLTNG